MASASACLAQTPVTRPSWKVSYPSSANGAAAESIAFPMEDKSLLVSVVTPGSDAKRPLLRMGNREVAVLKITHDPVSSLAFLKVGDEVTPMAAQWRANAQGIVGASLQATGPVDCRATGWIKQVGTKILPFSLLQVTFDQAARPPGTPLLDSDGKVVAIVFQASGGGNTCYAIPAEAVHRVRRDLSSGGRLVRAWLGLSLRAETLTPKVVSVLPNSPASAAGIQPSDVLIRVGERKITEYADAVNAFFYLIPGQPVRVRIQRGERQLEFTLTPTRPPAG